MTDSELQKSLEEDECKKQEIIERVYAEIGDAMDCDDEAILEEWAFEFGGMV